MRLRAGGRHGHLCDLPASAVNADADRAGGPSTRPASGGRAPFDIGRTGGNTSGMKAAISIPDPVFRDGERLARRLKTSRSQLYSMALSRFIAHHDEDAVTAGMNAALADLDERSDSFVRVAAQRTIARGAW